MSNLNDLELTHMDPLSLDDLARMHDTPGPCVSVYLPMRRSGRETRENPIRLKNAARTAVDSLIEQGMKPKNARALLGPAQGMVDNREYWQYQSNGLAIFVAPGFFHVHRLPVDFEERVAVAPHFFLKPLLPLFVSDGQFYVLALSLNRVRFFRGSRMRMAELQVPGLPASLLDALGAHQHERHLQQAKQGSSTTTVQFGTGEERDPQFHLVRFFQVIDRALHSVLTAARAPLVLAGVEDYQARYREVDTSSLLTAGMVAGNPDEVTMESLHQGAWEVVAPIFDQARESAVGRFHEFTARELGRTSNSIEEILPAACSGRVEDLFVVAEAERWGTCDRVTFTVDSHAEWQAGDEDLLELATTKTLFQSGAVWIMPRDRMPGGGELAAVFRY